MKRCLFLIAMLTVSILVFADGWVNVENEIQKNVQANSPKAPTIEFLDLTASMVNNEAKISNDISKMISPAKKKPGRDNCDEPYVMISFIDAQKVKDVLEGKEKVWKYLLLDDKFQGIVVYSGENLNNFFACPNPMSVGTYTVEDAGTHDFTLSFMEITTNASIEVSFQDDGYVVNTENSNEKMPSWHGFVSLNASVENLLDQLAKTRISREDIEKVLFKKPTDFHRLNASIEMANSSRHSKIFLWSWWLRVHASYDTPAGVYKDTVKVTVHADVSDW